ncbi:MAG: DJ-1/PfpI family protein [Dehalococcoidia bacterium]
MTEQRTIGIILFEGAEELDFVGPYEALAMFAKYIDKTWRVVTVSQTGQPVSAGLALRVAVDFSFDNCPQLDALLVPGGVSTREEVENATMIDFVRRQGERCQWVTSVCTGAFILSRAGFLKGRRATTHWASIDRLREEPGVTVAEERFVRDGNVVTAAGVSAGIDMALYLIGQLKDEEAARNVQKLMEYYPEPPYAEGAGVAAGKGAS